jgi:branched-subunit amino acid transport protein
MLTVKNSNFKGREHGEKGMKGRILLAILGMAVVTFLHRFLPMALLRRWTFPEKVKRGLDYIPVAVLSAIVFPLLFFDGKGSLGIQPRILFAAIPVFAFAWKIRSLWGAVLLGMLLYWIMGFV